MHHDVTYNDLFENQKKTNEHTMESNKLNREVESADTMTCPNLAIHVSVLPT